MTDETENKIRGAIMDVFISTVKDFEDYCTGECAVCSYSRKGSPCNLIRRILGVKEE